MHYAIQFLEDGEHDPSAGYSFISMPFLTGHQRITGMHKRDKHTSTFALTPRGNIDSSMNLTCVLLDCVSKPGQRVCKLEDQRIEPGSTPVILGSQRLGVITLHPFAVKYLFSKQKSR